MCITGTHENTPQVVNTHYGPEGWCSDSLEDCPKLSRIGLARLPPHRGDVANASNCPRRCANPEYTWQTLNAGFRPGMVNHTDRFSGAGNG